MERYIALFQINDIGYVFAGYDRRRCQRGKGRLKERTRHPALHITMKTKYTFINSKKINILSLKLIFLLINGFSEKNIFPYPYMYVQLNRIEQITKVEAFEMCSSSVGLNGRPYNQQNCLFILFAFLFQGIFYFSILHLQHLSQPHFH
jgi:hypothetical protein